MSKAAPPPRPRCPLVDQEVVEMAFQLRRQATGHDFLPLHPHRVVAISCALRDRDTFRVWSLGAETDGEAVLVQRFFDGYSEYAAARVVERRRIRPSRAALPGPDPRGESASLLGHGRRRQGVPLQQLHRPLSSSHCDLMDLLSLYQIRACAPLDEISQLLGLPGKLGFDGSQVWEAYQGRLADIRHYCETDVVNTYLVYLRFPAHAGDPHRRGALGGMRACAQYAGRLFRAALKEFLARWRGS